MEPQIIIIEDNTDLAQKMVRRLNLKNVIQNLEVVYTSDFNVIKSLLNVEDKYRAFIVDINLSQIKNDDREGIEIIKYIKKKSPKSLIMVHSATHDARGEAIEAGANFFFEKDLNSREARASDFLAMRNSVLQFFNIVTSMKISSKELNEIINEDLKKDLEEIEKDIAFYENIRSEKKALLKRLIQDKMGAHSGDSESMMRIEKKILKIGEEVAYNKTEIDNCRRKRNDLIKRKNNLLI